jgi:hypothetical protein
MSRIIADQQSDRAAEGKVMEKIDEQNTGFLEQCARTFYHRFLIFARAIRSGRKFRTLRTGDAIAGFTPVYRQAGRTRGQGIN